MHYTSSLSTHNGKCEPQHLFFNILIHILHVNNTYRHLPVISLTTNILQGSSSEGQRESTFEIHMYFENDKNMDKSCIYEVQMDIMICCFLEKIAHHIINRLYRYVI